MGNLFWTTIWVGFCFPAFLLFRTLVAVKADPARSAELWRVCALAIGLWAAALVAVWFEEGGNVAAALFVAASQFLQIRQWYLDAKTPDAHLVELSPTEEPPLAIEVKVSQPVVERKVPIVLSVDDDKINRKLVSTFLADEGVEIHEAESTEQALEFVRSQKPDLVLLDVMLPGASGIECLQEIRKQYSMAELPVIMVTARGQPEDFVVAYQAGANDYITKPFGKTELQARLHSHLELVQISSSYRRFVPSEFFNYMGKNRITEIKLGDHSIHEMAILFADIRAFTTLSESMTPQETFKFLNSYLTHTVPVIKKNRGFVDKYIGDAIMALFPEGGEWGVRAAVQMQKAIQQYNVYRHRSGYAPIQVAVGVHSGTLILGTVGEESRIEGTVISDAVNTASRLEAIAKKLDASILVSQNTLAQLPDPNEFDFRFLGRVTVKGKKTSVALFEIFDGSPESIVATRKATKNEFELGVVAYSTRKFDEAVQLFSAVLESSPNDNAAKYYYDNAKALALSPPPDDWDGALKLSV